MDVADWLRRLDLERYAAAFRENEIDAAVLPSLTAEDLRELGVTSVGHRRQLLDAITALRTGVIPARGSTQRPNTLPVGNSIGDGAAASTAERRPLSVMFCDVIGFTALSSRLDPEDLSAVIRSYQSCVATTIARFGGFIARYVGDGVLTYFGWPEAREADPEQAVRAALAVVDAISQTPSLMASLQVRIGIATGLVVVGESIGTGEARQQTAIGETPNIAARLQGLAEPNSVVIDAATRRQIGGFFHCRDLGLIALKGLREPVPAWQVVEQAAVDSRFEAFHAGAMTPLIGRDEELELLLRRWRQAKEGEGQLVLLSGEAGIGKSRLIAALEERVRGEHHRDLRYFCSPHHQDSALHPIVTRWERDLGFTRGDTPPEKLHKLATALTRVETSPEDVALIAEFLSVPVDDRYPIADLNPQRKKEKTFEALVQILANRARRQPLLMLFEDAHWADASSLELLDRTIGQLTNLPVLLVVSFRPEFRPPWVGLALASLITLRRLTQKQAALLAERVVVERVLSPTLLDRILTQADGVPLFIEELTKAMLEGTERSGNDAVPQQVPATLQASLISRLDRIPAAKQVAQIGAVIGREFGHALLADVAMMPEAQLAEGIDTLVASGLAFRRGVAPDADYTFKHALVRDAAYGTVLRSQRQELHARIGKSLEEHFPAIVDTQPELLAHHFAQAGSLDQAIEYWRRAGLRSVERSAHAEAGAHFACALELLGKLPPSEQRDAQELDLTLNLAVPLIAIHGFGALRVEQCALRAQELSDRLHGSSSRFAARRLAWNSCLMRQPVPRTVALARDLIGLANEDSSAAKLAVAHRALGYSLLMAGELREATENLARGASIADSISDREFAVYGEHPSMVCRNYGGKAKVICGFPTSGACLAEEAVARARREESAHSLAWALGVAAHIFEIHHEAEATIRYASEAIATARDHHMPQWLALGERCMGSAMHQLGDFAAGLNLQLQGIKRWTETGATLHLTHCEVHLVESYLREGQTAAARPHLDAARAHCATYGEEYLAAEIDRLEALLLLSEKAPAEIVEEYLMKSLNTARRQGARLFELRAATTFARVLAEKADHRRAADLLAPVYGWFTEGFDTTDLKEAKAVLDELR
jgi:class 3 adenylate cyclase/predicted ATPase